MVNNPVSGSSRTAEPAGLRSSKGLVPVDVDDLDNLMVVLCHGVTILGPLVFQPQWEHVRADLGGHLKYSRRWSGVRAWVLLGAQGAVRRGEYRGGL